MIGYTGFLGPTCYAIISETSSTRLRNKTLAFARMCYSIQGIVFNILNAYMINPTAFGWQGKTAFFWAPCAALSAVWCWYRLPELKDRCRLSVIHTGHS
jgi:SP family general alpha glucoside:H+ symporter-like MFS transporter